MVPVSAVPKLKQFWDYERNSNFDINLVSANSIDDSIHWKCEICGYRWERIVGFFNGNGAKCPQCDGKRPPIIKNVNDVLTLCPDFASIYNFELNELAGIDIYSLGPGSSTEVHCLCKKCGNEWLSPINYRVKKEGDTYIFVDCPKCSNRLFRTVPYSVEFPLLLKMYVEEQNSIALDSIRGADEIFAPRIWKCLNCGELFTSSITSMTKSYDTSTLGCPYCSHTKLREGESFAECHPDIMDEYDPDNTIDPTAVFCHCTDSVKWICRECGNKWEAPFSLRHRGYGNCPLCYRTAVLADKNSFAAVYPQSASTWSDKNDKKPTEVFFNASYWLYFNCPICGGLYGTWLRDYDNDNYHNCPYCKGLRPLPGFNTFKALYHDIAIRVPADSDFDADSVLPSSALPAPFLCDICHGVYYAPVRDAVAGIDECPYCAGKRVLPGFNSFFHNHPELSDELYALANHLLPITPDEVSDSSSYKFWWQCKNDASHHYTMSPKSRLMFQKRMREPCLYCRGHRRKLNHFIESPYK